MPNVFSCPACGRPISSDASGGTSVQCPLCNQIVAVPAAGAEPTAVPPQQMGCAPQMSSPLRSGLAIGALVCGILGFCFMPLGLVGLILGVVALIKINNNPTEYGGKGMAVAGVVTGGLSLLLGAVMLLAILLPSLANAREQARRVVCTANLRQIGTAVMMYATEHDNYLPPDLDALGPYLGSHPNVFKCAAAGKANYVYISGTAKITDVRRPSNTPIAYEPIGNHGDGGNVLFMDGHVRFVKQPRYDEILGPHLNRPEGP